MNYFAVMAIMDLHSHTWPYMQYGDTKSKVYGMVKGRSRVLLHCSEVKDQAETTKQPIETLPYFTRTDS